MDRRPIRRHLDLGRQLRAHVRARGGDRLRAVRGRPLPGLDARGAGSRRGGDRDHGHGRQGGAAERRDRRRVAARAAPDPEPALPDDGDRDGARRPVRPRRLADPAAGGACEARRPRRSGGVAMEGRRRASQRALRPMGGARLAPPAAHRDRSGDVSARPDGAPPVHRDRDAIDPHRPRGRSGSRRPGADRRGVRQGRSRPSRRFHRCRAGRGGEARRRLGGWSRPRWSGLALARLRAGPRGAGGPCRPRPARWPPRQAAGGSDGRRPGSGAARPRIDALRSFAAALRRA